MKKLLMILTLAGLVVPAVTFAAPADTPKDDTKKVEKKKKAPKKKKDEKKKVEKDAPPASTK